MSRDEEQKLIARARRGQTESFRGIVEAYQERLFAFVWRILRNHHEAEDVCQTAFAKAYQSLASYSNKYAFSTWLFTIAYRLCLNSIRKKKAISGNTDFSYIASHDESAEVSLANSEEARRLKKVIWAAVDKLSPAQKSAVLLFYRESKSCEEIGQVLSMPAVTVKSHLHRARAQLKRLLSGELVHDWMAMEFLADSHSA